MRRKFDACLLVIHIEMAFLMCGVFLGSTCNRSRSLHSIPDNTWNTDLIYPHRTPYTAYKLRAVLFSPCVQFGFLLLRFSLLFFTMAMCIRIH